MQLKQLSIQQFKNLKSLELSFSEKINCLVGRNGIGKTNVLDAIYYLSFTKSYLNAVDQLNVAHGFEEFSIKGKYTRKDETETILCAYKKGQKKTVKRNQKSYKKLQDHIGLFPLVIISPADRDLIIEGAETRRKFIDGVIAQSNKVYLDELPQYNRLLSQRNALLKYFQANHTFDEDSLLVYDHQLDKLAKSIYQARKEFTDLLSPKVAEFYAKLANNKERVSLEYQSKLEQDELVNLLARCRDKDRLVGHTTVGIHKDDLVFHLDNYPIRKFGSQGQQKSFLVALKLAQFELIAEQSGIKPLLLLDDVFDKLDEHRVAALVELVNQDFFGQIFITDTHANRTEDIVKRMSANYEMINMETYA